MAVDEFQLGQAQQVLGVASAFSALCSNGAAIPEPTANLKLVEDGTASLRNSSNTSILSLAIAVTSFTFAVDEGGAVASVLPAPSVSYTTS